MALQKDKGIGNNTHSHSSPHIFALSSPQTSSTITSYRLRWDQTQSAAIPFRQHTRQSTSPTALVTSRCFAFLPSQTLGDHAISRLFYLARPHTIRCEFAPERQLLSYITFVHLLVKVRSSCHCSCSGVTTWRFKFVNTAIFTSYFCINTYNY